MPAAVVRSYEPFSEDPAYLEACRQFVAGLPLPGRARALDLACGIGIISGMMLERAPDLRIAQLDLSREALTLARGRLGGRRDARAGGSLGFVEASADVLPVAAASVDAVIMANAIHMVPDADQLLAEAIRVLRPGGLIAFNTSFYAGTYPPGTEKFYHHWLMEALAFIAARDRALRSAGKPGIRRTRGTVRRAFVQPWPTLDEWRARLERNGFRVASVAERTVHMTQDGFRAIGAYAGLASVLLSGYPVDVACEALQAAVEPAFGAAAFDTVPRLWLEMSAVTASGGGPDAR